MKELIEFETWPTSTPAVYCLGVSLMREEKLFKEFSQLEAKALKLHFLGHWINVLDNEVFKHRSDLLYKLTVLRDAIEMVPESNTGIFTGV